MRQVLMFLIFEVVFSFGNKLPPIYPYFLDYSMAFCLFYILQLLLIILLVNHFPMLINIGGILKVVDYLVLVLSSKFFSPSIAYPPLLSLKRKRTNIGWSSIYDRLTRHVKTYQSSMMTYLIFAIYFSAKFFHCLALIYRMVITILVSRLRFKIFSHFL